MAEARLGRKELARRLGVLESLLEAWIGAKASMPDRKLLQLAALIDELGEEPPKE